MEGSVRWHIHCLVWSEIGLLGSKEQGQIHTVDPRCWLHVGNGAEGEAGAENENMAQEGEQEITAVAR